MRDGVAVFLALVAGSGLHLNGGSELGSRASRAAVSPADRRCQIE